MYKILFNLIAFLAITTANAQSLKKYPIKTATSESGCNLYAFCEMDFQTSFSEDSSVVYTGECTKDSVTYGVICVKLNVAIESLDEAEQISISYLDFLKSTFSITQAAGYGKGHRLNENENTRGVIDYWEDAEKNNWKVKAWTDKNYIVVLFAYTKGELNHSKTEIYLNSLRFPGM